MTISGVKTLPCNALFTPSLKRAKLVSRSSEKHNLQQRLKDVSRLWTQTYGTWGPAWGRRGEGLPAPGDQSDEGMAGTG